MNEKLKFLNFFLDSRRYAEEVALKEKVTDLIPGMVCVYESDHHRLRYVNKKFREYLGSAAGQIMQSPDPFEALVYQEDSVRVQKELEKIRLLDERSTHSFDCRFNHPTESFHYFRTCGTVLTKGSEGASSILFISEDITRQMKIQEEAQAREQLFDETEEALHFGTWSLDVETNEIVWTRGMFTLLGYEPAEFPQGISSDFFMDHVLPEYFDELKGVVALAIQEQKPFDYEYCIRTKSGEIKTVHTKGKVLCGNNGQVKKVFGITHDITALRNFEKEQARNLRELNRSNKELEEFAYVASHDLQEPLRKIAMFSERLRVKAGNSLEKDARLFLDRILAAADNMRILIDNLLEFSRANRLSHPFAETDLNKVLSDVKTNLELKIEETGTKLNIDQLPKLEAVGSQMEQVFRNLLSNSIKFRKKDVPPVISITSRKATRADRNSFSLKTHVAYFIIDVADNGIGFEQEYAERIFQIFHRLNGKTEYPGSGIGLAICKKIIENHNGMIAARSAVGQGSTFTIVIPEKQP